MNKIFAFILSIFSALFASTSAHASERAVQGWDLIAHGAKVVDVRTPQEFATGHLDNAVNIPLQELDQRIGELDKASDAGAVLPKWRAFRQSLSVFAVARLYQDSQWRRPAGNAKCSA